MSLSEKRQRMAGHRGAWWGRGTGNRGRQEEGQTTSQVRQSKAKPKSLHAWNRAAKAGHNGQRMMQDSGLH